MNNKLNERIMQVISHEGITKSAFAARLNVSPAFVTQLCNGTKLPSDRTISDICREFGCNRTWLETGEGEPFLQGSRDEQIADFMNDVMKSESDDFRRRMIAALSKLSVAEWEVLENMAVQMAAEAEQERSGKRLHVVKIAGRDGALEERTLTDEEFAKLDKLPDVPEGL